ncbi:unnamed protein product (macronuclear) [Paramecium tetraurelia]|uniref:Uncharacterized protein n=1 Tax=Paramecium tetraurelia TaxID=5888 RepID=A0C0E8_PARTE|nr:uncharacterized protein GSPATT00006118001 [Paramecium tetraurelia]CAK64265.1 unnamed protein product [Paramecium tetraurelia]|eukprot:XP_001431663.1 hypothetical protein (macronuclear) [Paramecium tetraurelia strain d4-2]
MENFKPVKTELYHKVECQAQGTQPDSDNRNKRINQNEEEFYKKEKRNNIDKNCLRV